MLREESIWIKKVLEETDTSSVNEVLDVGSSTRQFRTQTQAYIDENVFRPLRERNISISYLDKKNSEGVDYVYDIENMSVEKITRKFDLVICCSLLEHVQNPNQLCGLLIDLLKEQGFLLITVPRSYRHHPDPIDTMFRPSMEKLISMFPRLEIIRKDVVCVKDRKKYKIHKISELFRYLIPPFNWKVNCLFMRKSKL